MKIFLEFPDEIYKFETGCNDEDDSDKKIHEIAKDQVETESFKISEDLEDKSMTMEEESVLITPNKIGEDSIKSTPQKNKTKLSPLTSSHTPPPSSRQFPNQQTLLELALVQRTPPSVGRHDSSNFNGDRKFRLVICLTMFVS